MLQREEIQTERKVDMAWYDFLTGVDVQKNIDHVASGIDMLVYTNEEKAIEYSKINDARLAAISKASVSRRVISIAITFEALLLVDATVALHLMGWVADAKFVETVLVEFMLQPFLAVVGFYFLAHITGKKP